MRAHLFLATLALTSQIMAASNEDLGMFKELKSTLSQMSPDDLKKFQDIALSFSAMASEEPNPMSLESKFLETLPSSMVALMEQTTFSWIDPRHSPQCKKAIHQFFLGEEKYVQIPEYQGTIGATPFIVHLGVSFGGLTPFVVEELRYIRTLI